MIPILVAERTLTFESGREDLSFLQSWEDLREGRLTRREVDMSSFDNWPLANVIRYLAGKEGRKANASDDSSVV
jgi:hypothetical protein